MRSAWAPKCDLGVDIWGETRRVDIWGDSPGDSMEWACGNDMSGSVVTMRRRLPALTAAFGLLAAGLTGLVVTPAASAFEPSLNFIECPADAEPAGVECAELTVPLDWQTPDDGRTTTIALRVIRSPRGAGGFTFNPGGPGGSGIKGGEFIYRDLPRQIQRRYDFVMWDPRGVGLSGPEVTGCQPKPGPSGLPDTGPVDWQAIWTDYAIESGEAIADCFAKNPDSAPYLGTWQVAHDLEAMRIALGYPRWNYWGMSYGTRIGYTYATLFPDSIRTMIVDGSLWPQESIFRLANQQPAAWNTALQVYSSVMGRAQTRKLERILEALDDTVIESPQGTITRWGVTLGIYGQLGVQAFYPNIRTSINALYDALFTEKTPRSRVSAFEALQALEDPEPDPSVNYIFSFINCADLHDRPSPAAAGRMAVSVERNYGTTMPIATNNIVNCQGLPADYSPGVNREWRTIELRTPPVVVLALGDKNTPWIWGRTMANQYARSRTITYNSSQHVTYLSTPSTCVNDPVTRYVLFRKLPQNNIFCPFVPSA
jgi:pimeloyl-ACP methyl ester carboxylesterase